MDVLQARNHTLWALKEAHDCLVEFKTWANEEFGGVRSAFKALDSDTSGSLNYKEFKAACRNYGFTGDCR